MLVPGLRERALDKFGALHFGGFCSSNQVSLHRSTESVDGHGACAARRSSKSSADERLVLRMRSMHSQRGVGAELLRARVQRLKCVAARLRRTANFRVSRQRAQVIVIRLSTIAVVVALLVFAGPARAASIDPDPPSVGAPADTGAGIVVPVSATASFDPEADFAEADLFVVGPDRAYDQSEFYYPGGDFSFARLNFYLSVVPGTYHIQVVWSTHGLGNSDAESPTVSFTVTDPATPPSSGTSPPPPPPGKTDADKDALNRAAADWNILAAQTAVVAMAFGAAALAFPPAAAAFGLASLIAGATSGVAWYANGILGKAALDPPDPNYQVQTVVIVPHVPRVTRSKYLQPTDAAAINAYLALNARVAGLVTAFDVSMNRASGAYAGGVANPEDPTARTWETRQVQAEAGFAGQLAVTLREQHGVGERAMRGLRRLNRALRAHGDVARKALNRLRHGAAIPGKVARLLAAVAGSAGVLSFARQSLTTARPQDYDRLLSAIASRSLSTDEDALASQLQAFSTSYGGFSASG